MLESDLTPIFFFWDWRAGRTVAGLPIAGALTTYVAKAKLISMNNEVRVSLVYIFFRFSGLCSTDRQL